MIQSQEYSDFFQNHQLVKGDRSILAFYDKQRAIVQLERNPKVFQLESPSKFNMVNKNRDKNKDQGDSAATEGASGDSITSTRSMLKIRSTPTDGEQKAKMREWSTETDNAEFHIPAIPYGNRNIMVENSQGHSLPSSLTPPLPSLALPESENFLENRKESQIAEPLCTSCTTLGNAPDAPFAPGTCKLTHESFGKPAKKYSDQLYL